MSLAYGVTPRARDEIDAAQLYYDGQRPGLGDDFLIEVHDFIRRIAAMPGLDGIVARDIRGGPLATFPYVVYYRVEPTRVVVVGVLHGHANPRRLRGR
jgi:plasmid stabilization system protein ParE